MELRSTLRRRGDMIGRKINVQHKILYRTNSKYSVYCRPSTQHQQRSEQGEPHARAYSRSSLPLCHPGPIPVENFYVLDRLEHLVCSYYRDYNPMFGHRLLMGCISEHRRSSRLEVELMCESACHAPSLPSVRSGHVDSTRCNCWRPLEQHAKLAVGCVGEEVDWDRAGQLEWGTTPRTSAIAEQLCVCSE